MTWIVAAGAAVLGLLLTFAALDRRRVPDRPERRGMLFFAGMSLLIVILFEVTFSHVQEGGLFDRHILTATFPLVILAGLLSNETRNRSSDEKHPNPPSPAVTATARMGLTIAAALFIAAFALFGVTAAHDYLSWNRLRWELGNELLAQKVDPLSISGGFEFNAWNNYDTFRARGNIDKTYYWWYDRPDYVIAMEPQEGYHPLKRREYYSWLHRRELQVYLLRRE